jgi:hypothetical protein
VSGEGDNREQSRGSGLWEIDMGRRTGMEGERERVMQVFSALKKLDIGLGDILSRSPILWLAARRKV